jgi:hypothetical protein
VTSVMCLVASSLYFVLVLGESSAKDRTIFHLQRTGRYVCFGDALPSRTDQIGPLFYPRPHMTGYYSVGSEA